MVCFVFSNFTIDQGTKYKILKSLSSGAVMYSCDLVFFVLVTASVLQMRWWWLVQQLLDMSTSHVLPGSLVVAGACRAESDNWRLVLIICSRMHCIQLPLLSSSTEQVAAKEAIHNMHLAGYAVSSGTSQQYNQSSCMSWPRACVWSSAAHSLVLAFGT